MHIAHRKAAPRDGYFQKIPEGERRSWSRDEADRPKARNLATFLRGFDAELVGLVLNLAGQPVLEEEA